MARRGGPVGSTRRRAVAPLRALRACPPPAARRAAPGRLAAEDPTQRSGALSVANHWRAAVLAQHRPGRGWGCPPVSTGHGGVREGRGGATQTPAVGQHAARGAHQAATTGVMAVRGPAARCIGTQGDKNGGGAAASRPADLQTPAGPPANAPPSPPSPPRSATSWPHTIHTQSPRRARPCSTQPAARCRSRRAPGLPGSFG
jgi:hypothetical protein